MRIHATLCGHYDWEPAPPGTVITDEDRHALRVKDGIDGKPYIRIDVERDTHLDLGPHEATICDRIAGRLLKGHEMSRTEVVADVIRDALPHHAPARCITKIEVHDEGPVQDLLVAALAARGIAGSVAEVALEQYLEPADVEAQLNTLFVRKRRTKSDPRKVSP